MEIKLTGMMRHDTSRHWLPCFLAVERDALQKAGGQMLSCNGLLDWRMHAQCLIPSAAGGYMVMAYATTKYCFDVQPGEWLTAVCTRSAS